MAELSHQQARSLILSAGDASLLPLDGAALATHLETCSECQAYFRSLEVTRQKVRRSLHRRWDPAQAEVSMQKIQARSRRHTMLKKISVTAGTLAVIAIVVFAVRGISGPLPADGNATRTLAPAITATSGSGQKLQDAPPALATTLGTNVTPVQLGKGVILPYVRWSPDGQRLIIHSADDLLFYAVNRDGSGLSRLSDLQAWDARWSADSRTIRICQEQTGQPAFKVFSVSPDGSNLTELPAEEAVAAVLDGHCPSTWSPDGKTIAFAKSDSSGLYFVDANGQNIRQVVAPDLAAVNVLKWSMDPSGSSLIFSAIDPAKTGAPTGIYTTQIDNAGHIVSRYLLHLLTELESFSWSLSPDGQKIIYVPLQPTGIYIANVVNSGAWTKLTDLQTPNGDAETLQWSPDGSQIAFSSNVNGDPDIFVIDADGTNLRYYPNPGPAEQPVGWSPDGQSLVFSSQLREDPQTPVGPFSLNLIDVKDLTAYGPAPTSTPLKAITGAGQCQSSTQPGASSDKVAYTVQAGDTLSLIAANYGVSVQSIRDLNGFSATSAIQVGQSIWIPLSTHVVVTPSILPPLVYTVRQGDVISSVAQAFKVSVQSLIILNNLDAKGTLTPGQILKVPFPTSTGEVFFGWPLSEHFLSGKDYSSAHPGLDLAGKAGEDVQSSGVGTVIFAGMADGGLGNTVVLDQGNGYTSVYAHLVEVRVACGASTAAGQVLGTVGESGDATKPVLYFEIRHNDIPQDPWNFLPPP
jgi:murein DD-endopeptidase MepM/ murein hydrolase activator NlpD/Tol biopolymer transport system component